MLRINRYKFFSHALFLLGCLFPLTFLRMRFNFQLFDLALIILFLLFARKKVNLFALTVLVVLGTLSFLALSINDRSLLDALETIGDFLQISFLFLIVLPLFRSMDDELHQKFFRGFVLATTVLSALMLSMALRIAEWPVFEEMYTQRRWSIIRMEPNSTARVFFTAFAALFVIGDGRILRGFWIKAIMGVLLLVAGSLTGSRTFYLALFTLGIVFALLLRRKIINVSLLLIRRHWIRLTLISFLFLYSLNLSPVQRSVSTILEKAFGSGRTTLFTTALDSTTGLTGDSDSQRVFLLYRSIEAFFQNFFLGTGLSMSIYSFNDIIYRNIWIEEAYVAPTVHNAFIGFVLETGVFGLILIIFLAVRLGMIIYRCPRQELVILLTVLVFDMTSTLQWTRMNWIPVLAFVTWNAFLLRQGRKISRQSETISAPITGLVVREYV